MSEDRIPYDDLQLREAYRRGRKAWTEGQTPPADDRFHRDDIRKAFIRGYEDAEDSEPW